MTHVGVSAVSPRPRYRTQLWVTPTAPTPPVPITEHDCSRPLGNRGARIVPRPSEYCCFKCRPYTLWIHAVLKPRKRGRFSLSRCSLVPAPCALGARPPSACELGHPTLSRVAGRPTPHFAGAPGAHTPRHPDNTCGSRHVPRGLRACSGYCPHHSRSRARRRACERVGAGQQAAQATPSFRARGSFRYLAPSHLAWVCVGLRVAFRHNEVWPVACSADTWAERAGEGAEMQKMGERSTATDSGRRLLRSLLAGARVASGCRGPRLLAHRHATLGGGHLLSEERPFSVFICTSSGRKGGHR